MRSDEAQYSQRIPADTLAKIAANNCTTILNHVIADEYEVRKSIWTAAASCGMELDHNDGIRVAVFIPSRICLPGSIVSGGTIHINKACTMACNV